MRLPEADLASIPTDEESVTHLRDGLHVISSAAVLIAKSNAARKDGKITFEELNKCYNLAVDMVFEHFGESGKPMMFCALSALSFEMEATGSLDKVAEHLARMAEKMPPKQAERSEERLRDLLPRLYEDED